MNKLGFYVEKSTVEFLRDALSQVKPPTILWHVGDRGLLQEIRSGRAPNAFIIGRWPLDLGEQEAMLDSPDPDARGRELADRIIGYYFGYAFEKGANGRLLIDAWMSLNEVPRGPASFPGEQVDELFKRRASAFDRFQVAFRKRLQEKGLEAVAFNFAAGNFIKPEHYLQWFPLTLAAYTYLGFHEYGWPTLEPQPGTSTAALFYRTCMEGIRQKHGARHQVIITEAGLARGYKHPHDPAGDVGWLYEKDAIPQPQYWKSLKWYNAELCKDDYVKGACLFEVGHAGGRWESFRHLGKDNQSNAIQIINWIEKCLVKESKDPECDGGDDHDHDHDHDNDGDNGNGNGDNPADLRERVAAVKALLTTADGQARAVIEDSGQAHRIMTEFTPDPAPAAALVKRVRDLLVRLDALQARLAQSALTNRDALLQQVADLRAQLVATQPAAERAAVLPGDLAAARSQAAALADKAKPLPALRQSIAGLLAEAAELERELPSDSKKPQITDLSATLPRHADKTYPQRAASAIRRIVVHHTATKPDVTPERIAQAQVNGGKAGITYHFVVAADGALFQTQPLTLAVEQATVADVNADAVGVALVGNFTTVAPPSAQLSAAGRLIAWLLTEFKLSSAALYGRRELDAKSASPGDQWLSGARYKDALLQAVKAV